MLLDLHPFEALASLEKTSASPQGGVRCKEVISRSTGRIFKYKKRLCATITKPE